MPLPRVLAIPATPHEETVAKFFAHRNKPSPAAPGVPHEEVAGNEVVNDIKRVAATLPDEPESIAQSHLERALLNRYTYHPPKNDQQTRYETIRAAILQAAKVIVGSVPPCNELERALEGLDCAMMFANAGIARNE